MTELTIIFSTLSLLLIWASIVWFWKDYFLDEFRQSMFKLRDELFLMAADGLIPFEHPAYGMQRLAINGTIRFAHRISLTQYIAFSLFVRGSMDALHVSYQSRWNAALEDLDAPARAAIIDIRNRSHALVIMHCIKSSPVLVAMVVPWLLLLLLGYLFIGILLDVGKRSLDLLDAAAIAESENGVATC